MNNEFKLSGKTGNIFIIGILFGPILVTLLSIIYAYIDVYNPIIYLTLVVYVGFLFGIILVQKLVIRLSKCRSRLSSIIYGIFTGLLGVYVSWCAFIYVIFSKDGIPLDLLDFLRNPTFVFETANLLSIDGYFSLFGSSVKGGLLWFIWIVEAIGILGAGALGGLAVIHEEVFCEDCNRWAKDLNFDLRLAIENKEVAKEIIENNIEKLLDFDKIENPNSEHIRVNLHQCPNCLNTNTIDIDLITYEKNNKGEVKEKNEDFSKVYMLSPNQINSFINKKNN